jgi:hypothetical protein
VTESNVHCKQAKHAVREALQMPKQTTQQDEIDLSPCQIHTVRILWIYGFMIWITDLRYGFTEVRILRISNKPCHKNAL